MRELNLVIVHCSDSFDYQDFKAADIHDWHLARGWAGIGYHHVIDRSGVVEAGRPEYWVGAHAKDYNAHSIGICLIGKKIFTDDQHAALEVLIKRYRERFPDIRVVGHWEVDPGKTCPNFDVQDWLTRRGMQLK